MLSSSIQTSCGTHRALCIGSRIAAALVSLPPKFATRSLLATTVAIYERRNDSVLGSYERSGRKDIFFPQPGTLARKWPSSPSLSKFRRFLVSVNSNKDATSPLEETGNSDGHSSSVEVEGADENEVGHEADEEVTELKRRLLICLADSENARRRHMREKESIRQFAISAFAKSLLDVVDNLAVTVSHLQQQSNFVDVSGLAKILEGVEMTYSGLKRVLDSHGVVDVTPVEGDLFDANIHDSLFQIEDSEEPRGTICKVFKSGYKLNNRVLRRAQVATSK